jgi:hypothetical protein
VTPARSAGQSTLIRSAAVGRHGRSSFRPLASTVALVTLLATPAARPAAQTGPTCRDNLRERVCLQTDAQGRLVVTARALEASPETLPAVSVELRPLFSQRRQILDVLDVAGQRIVLDPTAITTYTRGEAGWRLDHATALSAPIPWPRDLRGHLTLRGDTVLAQLPALTCVGAAAPHVGRFTCEPGQQGVVETPAASSRGDDEVTLVDECRREPHAVVRIDADGGSDALGVFDVRNRANSAAPARLLQGRLTALWAGSSDNTATAVVRAPDADRYDAYQIRLACVR